MVISFAVMVINVLCSPKGGNRGGGVNQPLYASLVATPRNDEGVMEFATMTRV